MPVGVLRSCLNQQSLQIPVERCFIPGNLTYLTWYPFSLSASCKSWHCDVFPDLSSPSITTRHPRFFRVDAIDMMNSAWDTFTNHWGAGGSYRLDRMPRPRNLPNVFELDNHSNCVFDTKAFMEGTNGEISRLPTEMLSFTLTQLKLSPRTNLRLGTLLGQGRPPITTPHYVVPTSRGIVPHLSHDIMQRQTSISMAHVALEDCKTIVLLEQLSLTLCLQMMTSCRKITKSPSFRDACVCEWIATASVHCTSREGTIYSRASENTRHPMPYFKHKLGNFCINVGRVQVSGCGGLHQGLQLFARGYQCQSSRSDGKRQKQR